MTKTKSKETDVAGKMDIPVAIRGKSASDLLSGLADKAQKQSKTADKKERPELPLTKEVQELYRRFAPAKALLDKVSSEVDNVKEQLNEELFDAWGEVFWNQKSRPGNPNIRVRDEDGRIDCEGMFIVQERFKFQIPDNENPAESVIRGLSEKSLEEDVKTEGLSRLDAEALVSSEVSFTPQVSLRPFNELVNGHSDKDRNFIESTAEEKAVGQKLLEFVTNNLTAEEQALVLLNVPKTVVKNGFLQRLCSYVRSPKQLTRVFQYFTPVVQNKGAKFAVSDTPRVRVKRLQKYAEDLLGSVD